MPNVVLADTAFTLRPYVLKPYKANALTNEQLNANRVISSSRRVVESTFGILVHRFKVLFRRLGLHPSSVNRIVGACICLHNWLVAHNAYDCSEEIMSMETAEILRERSLYQKNVFIANENEHDFREIMRRAAQESNLARIMRNEFCLYVAQSPQYRNWRQ